MRSLGALFAMARADFLERARRYGFWVTLIACVYAGHGFLPPNNASYATLQMGGHRGIYNSAWVGSLEALLCSVFLSLVGFYLVRNAVERDRQTRVGEILAATSIGRAQYTVGKTLSNFAVLAAMVAVVAVSAGVVQLLRGESHRIDAWAIAAPFVFLTLPVLLMTAAVAVVFEVTPVLRGGVGNIAYVFVWMLGLTMAGGIRDPLGTGNDLLGRGVVLPSMMNACRAAFPDFDPATSSLSMGLTFKESGAWSLTTFEWQGIRWTLAVAAGRLVWVAAGLALAALAALPFDRFDPARSRGASRARAPRGRRARAGAPAAEPGASAVAVAAAPVHLTPLAAAATRSGPLGRLAACILAELKLTLRPQSRWWYLGWLVLAALALALPLQISRLRILPLLWIWPVLIWSPLGTRERRHGTDAVLFSAPHPLGTQFGAIWIAGVLVTIAAGLPVAARLLVAGDMPGLFGWTVGALFIPTLALALGTWTGVTRAFEAGYTLLWYVGPLQPTPALDFMGASREAVARGMPWVYLAATGILLALAVLGRRRQL
jgi:hypothetical protein